MKNVKIGDIVVIALIVVITAGVFFFRLFSFGEGRSVEITTENGVIRHSLNEDNIFEINSRGITLSVVINDKKVYVETSDCPNRNCINMGKISEKGQSIACVPAGVYIKIVGEGESGYDYVIG